MLDALNFVRGAIAKKDFVPALNHFRITGGRVTGFNGAIALSSPIACDLDCAPAAKPFVKAIQTCRDTVALHLTANNRLAVQAGQFRAYIECLAEPYPAIAPSGESISMPPGLTSAFKQLAPFIAEDASRPWARGILFRGSSALATNNIVVIEKWLTQSMLPGEMNVPEEAVLELLRIGEDPHTVQADGRSLTFHFSGERWLRCQLLSTAWPNVDSVWRDVDAPSVPAGLFQALEDLKPFVDELGRIYLSPGKVATSTAQDDGASVQVEGITTEGIFNIDQLLKLKEVAYKLDLGCFPTPSPFYGKGLRGILCGMRL